MSWRPRCAAAGWAWAGPAGPDPVGMSEPQDKPFDIPKQLVWEAYKRVKANEGAAGVDRQSLEESDGHTLIA